MTVYHSPPTEADKPARKPAKPSGRPGLRRELRAILWTALVLGALVAAYMGEVWRFQWPQYGP